MQELQEIRSLARDFASAELRPHAEAWDAAGALPDDVAAKLGELGFFGMLVPEAAGGMGLDLPTWVSALEELSWGEPSAALLVMHSVIAADLIARHGGEELADAWLEPLATGAVTACLAFTESGDHPPTVARRDGDGWRITGRKPWVSNGERGGLFLVLAEGPDGPGVFVAAAGEGVRVVQRHATLGMRAAGLADVQFDESVANAARLDDAAAGTVAGDVMGRLSTAAIAAGIAQAALEHAIRYSGEREQFGRPIGSFEGIQRKLADMATRTVAARALVEKAAADPESVTLSAMAKLAAAECAMFVTTEAVQIFGGYGYMRDYPVEKLMRDAKAMEIMHGPNEVQRIRIAESLRA
jgi:alkylation response protein AidB-like acyl-CoA dehydrogenase